MCQKTTHPNLRRRLSAFMRKKDEPTKASPQSMVYPKPASPNGCSEFNKECQASLQAKEDYDFMKENLRLKRENEELRKETAFLKKRRHSLQKKSVRGLPVY